MKAIFVLLAFAVATHADDAAVQEFVNGNHLFTAGVYKELLKTEQGNFLVSPFSAETILALTQEGTKGNTRDQFTRGLNLPSTVEKTQAAIKSFLPRFKSSTDDLKLLSANKVYVNEGFSIKDDFKKIATSVYEAGVENIKFSEKEKAAATINGWVEGQTNDKIKDLIAPDSLEGVVVVLVNALYFKGKWETPFEKYLTSKQDFFKTAKDVVKVDTMRLTDRFNYYESKELNAKFLELPYVGENVTMTIILPNEKEGLSALEGNIEKVFARPEYKLERVDISLPKFTIETKIPFIPILKNLGITDAFDSNADLSGIAGKKGDLVISEVIQKTFINVTETGTEAAAATAVGVALLSAPRPPPVPPKEFKADHSFALLLKYNDAVLFAGRYSAS